MTIPADELYLEGVRPELRDRLRAELIAARTMLRTTLIVRNVRQTCPMCEELNDWAATALIILDSFGDEQINARIRCTCRNCALFFDFDAEQLGAVLPYWRELYEGGRPHREAVRARQAEQARQRQQAQHP